DVEYSRRSSMDQQLAALVGRHLTAENGQDLAATVVSVHPECVFKDLATGQVWNGHEGAAAHYRQWWTTFDVTVKRGPGQSGGATRAHGTRAAARTSRTQQ